MSPMTLLELPKGTMSVTAVEGSVAISGAACPSGAPASWSASVQIAEKIGQARLVPPITPTCPLRTTIPPVYGSATAEISGTCRYFPGRNFCHDGLEMYSLTPPPEPD